MNYTAIMAHTYSGDPYSVLGWYASRKLNGWRAIWDGYSLKTLGRYSGSKPIYTPGWWVLPKGIPMDGELWHSSDNKDMVKSIAGQGIAKSVNDPRWSDIRFMALTYKPYSCYDSSITEESLDEKFNREFYLNNTWLNRQRILQRYLDSYEDTCLMTNRINYTRLHEQTLVSSVEQVKSILEASKIANHEGVCFANPLGLYTCKRSHDILKSKPLYDHECSISGINPGEGKHIGRVGSLQCVLKWNEQVTSFKGGTADMVGKTVFFNCGGGLSDDKREEYMGIFPKRIRFSFLEVSKSGIPQSPNFLEEYETD